jgi:DNA-directed RNA polymerase specialized sigma24 family protein
MDAMFEGIQRQYQDSVYRHILERVEEPQIAEELSVETFLQAFRLWWENGVPAPEADLKAWLLHGADVIVSTAGIGRRPRWFRQPIAPEAIEAVVACLSEDEKAIFLLAHRDDLSYEEIAVRLGLTVPAVKARLHRVRGRIRRDMDNETTTFTFAPHRILISRWKRPLVEGDGLTEETIAAGETRLGVRLPAVLREWYRIAGKRDDLTVTQVALWLPDELVSNDAGLVCFAEAKGPNRWIIRRADMEQEDPPVYRADSTAETPESPTLTEFLLLMLAQDIILSHEWSGFGSFWEPAENVLNELAVSRMGTSEWRWPQYPTRFYEGTNLLVMTNGDEWFWFAAIDREDHLVLLNRLEDKVLWENVNRGEA